MPKGLGVQASIDRSHHVAAVIAGFYAWPAPRRVTDWLRPITVVTAAVAFGAYCVGHAWTVRRGGSDGGAGAESHGLVHARPADVAFIGERCFSRSLSAMGT
jgi:hypothetical protein